MKTFVFSVILSFSILNVVSQNFPGDWEGKLDVQGIQLRIIFHIKGSMENFTASLDSPDQGAYDLPVDSLFIKNNEIKMIMTNLGAEYTGTFYSETDKIKGNFKQVGQSFPLKLSRTNTKKEKKKRSQEPKKPYPYISENVYFKNLNAGITLAGTLTMPEGKEKFPAVILISGSGPQNRNEELLGHKPFLIIADYLTRNGIAVLRYDDRGTAESEGNFSKATTKDFATDAEAAFDYLLSRTEIDKNNIGLIGHSEGGLIAPMVAVDNKNIAFIVLLAGPGLPGDEILLKQAYLIGKANGATEKELKETKKISKKIYDQIKNEPDTAVMKQEIKTLLKQAFLKQKGEDKLTGEKLEAAINRQIKMLTSPWFKFFLSYNPALTLEKVSCPVLALFGSKDLQVPPEEDKTAIEKAVTKGGNADYKAIIIPGLNHLFQECKTGSPSEYAQIDQTFSPLALKEIFDWIKKHEKK